jgi:hypothetical protein
MVQFMQNHGSDAVKAEVQRVQFSSDRKLQEAIGSLKTAEDDELEGKIRDVLKFPSALLMKHSDEIFQAVHHIMKISKKERPVRILQPLFAYIESHTQRLQVLQDIEKRPDDIPVFLGMVDAYARASKSLIEAEEILGKAKKKLGHVDVQAIGNIENEMHFFTEYKQDLEDPNKVFKVWSGQWDSPGSKVVVSHYLLDFLDKVDHIELGVRCEVKKRVLSYIESAEEFVKGKGDILGVSDLRNRYNRIDKLEKEERFSGIDSQEVKRGIALNKFEGADFSELEHSKL